ncbi:hypothetical protein [Brucella anthropi]|nr:hypothetical protein [Brucella anthropi]
MGNHSVSTIWQDRFPTRNTKADSYFSASLVGSFCTLTGIYV